MKQQPDLAGEAAAVREMTRQAHEVMKDLRAAIRESRAERAAIVAEINTGIAHLQAELNRTIENQSAEAQQAFGEMIRHIQRETDKVLDYMAKLMGAASTDEFWHRMARQITADLQAHRAAVD